MLSLLRFAWHTFIAPILERPKSLQMAALCHRGCGDHKEYLLVTSRGTRRWIIPKGWPIRGLKSNETALREAWEEAGVINSLATDKPIGSYIYKKTQANGFELAVETLVYSVAVKEMSEHFPEEDQRRLKWVDAETAADLVSEVGLKSIIRNFK